MSSALPHNKLRVRYRVLQQGETATVMAVPRCPCRCLQTASRRVA